MQIIADANMPGLAPFEPWGTLTRVDGRGLTRDQLGDAEVLLVRSVTRVDERLLGNSRVRFVGSATIGTDHVDLDFLHQQGIAFAHAPGCNARAVAEYVLQAALLLCRQQQRTLRGTRAAVIGLGNVGRRVAQWLQAVGMTVRVCDPPLAEQGYTGPWALESLDALLDADLISLHVPLTDTGMDATRHLLGASRLKRLGPEQMLLNTCRGPVIDNQALYEQLASGRGPLTILDVWEQEPLVPPPLYREVLYGSPHIAGYSQEGKLAGTDMLYQAFCRWQGHTDTMARSSAGGGVLEKDVHRDGDLLALLQHAYRLEQDSQRLGLSLSEEDPAKAFDALRKHYPERHELHHWRHQGDIGENWLEIMRLLFEPA